jgi:formylglycine-generating enzyme required for sulfatase activity
MKSTPVSAVVLLALALSASAGAQTCRSDLNGDGQVNGADLGILLADWGFCPATISSVSPAQGSTQGGTVISITGTGLQTTSGVRVGGVACTNVTVLTPTLVRATTPPGQPGEASVAVTTNGGTTLASSPFIYVQQQITSVVPSVGPYSGGTPITVNGQFLAGATAVTVGGVPCTNVVSVSPTQVTAVTPAGSVGPADVVVTCAKGTVTAAGAFTYLSVVTPSWATLIEALPDPAVVTDPALRAAITATGLAWRVRDTGTGIEMLLVPPGTFQMGCDQAPTGETCPGSFLPLHTVTLTGSYYLGRYEVTQSEWFASEGSNPSFFHDQPDSERRPVERVNWDQAKSFASANGLRLPTEAEWEFACKAGTTTAFYNFSNDPSALGEIAWVPANSDSRTHAVGGKAPNRLGFYDMIGNVWELVADYWGDYSPAPQTNPTGPATGSRIVGRGGSYETSNPPVYSSTRSPTTTLMDSSSIAGFRVARDP